MAGSRGDDRGPGRPGGTRDSTPVVPSASGSGEPLTPDSCPGEFPLPRARAERRQQAAGSGQPWGPAELGRGEAGQWAQGAGDSSLRRLEGEQRPQTWKWSCRRRDGLRVGVGRSQGPGRGRQVEGRFGGRGAGPRAACPGGRWPCTELRGSSGLQGVRAEVRPRAARAGSEDRLWLRGGSPSPEAGQGHQGAAGGREAGAPEPGWREGEEGRGPGIRWR